MTRKERFEACVAYFQEKMPNAETELHFGNTYELLVAVILSAQCTDKRVNMVTPAFFRRYPDIPSLAKAEYDDVFELIKSISFPGNKSRHLLGMARMVTEKFGGEIPMTVENWCNCRV
jgi:endonuclease-3